MIDKTEHEIMKNWKPSVKPVVSVCCTTYNHENYISEAIDGFLIQKTNFPFEIIIRDDCSTDETATIIETYANKFPNIIKPIFESENQYSKGIKPMAAVFKKAVGNYFALCEGDDYWTDPEKLQIQVNSMRDKPECYMSFHPVKHRTVNKLTDTQFKYKKTPSPMIQSDHVSYAVYSIEEVIVLGGYYISTPAVMLDRKIIEELPPVYYNAPIGDYILKVLGSFNGGALYIDKAMSAYRILSEGSWSATHEEDTDLKSDYYIRTLNFLDEVNSHFDNKFENAIFQRKSVYYYALSNIYLNGNEFAIFKRYIQLAYNSGSKLPFGLKLTYYLRNHPNILVYIKNSRRLLLKQNY